MFRAKQSTQTLGGQVGVAQVEFFYLRKRLGPRQTAGIEMPAREFQFPPEPLLLFLYNPFSGEIFRSVMQRLAPDSNALYIVYVNPLHADVISAEARMKLIARDDWCAIWKRAAGEDA